MHELLFNQVFNGFVSKVVLKEFIAFLPHGYCWAFFFSWAVFGIVFEAFNRCQSIFGVQFLGIESHDMFVLGLNGFNADRQLGQPV